MSRLPSDFPKMPRVIDGQILPDFINAKIIERHVKFPVPTSPQKYDFSIQKSDAFGISEGKEFDEGATWFPLHLVHITCSDNGIGSYTGHYAKGATATYGTVHTAQNKVSLAKDEYIKGISGTYTDRVTSLNIHTTKTTHKIGNESGQAFQFDVPEDHHVVGFHGRSDDHIRAIGVSYSRRLDSIAPKPHSAALGASGFVNADVPPGPPADIKPIYSNIYLDAETKAQWAANNMDAVEKKRNQAKSDLQPIYQNISTHGETAWTLVEAEGEKYYLSWTKDATMWSYVKDQPTTPSKSSAFGAADPPPKTKTSIVSIGSYSANANILGLSGYVWSSIPITAVASVIALSFVIFMKGLITDGVTWGIQFAATQLAQAAADAGLDALAALVPESVASLGGLVTTGILGIALFFAVMALSSIIFKQFFLTVNVFNFDADHKWKTLEWHSDNAKISNGEWKPESIDKFIPAGAGVAPPGFKPVKNLDNVATYFSIAFENDSKLTGLGVGLLLARDDNTVGLALKYVVHKAKDNEIGVMGITTGDPRKFDLAGYYKGSWVSSADTSTTVGNLKITAHTPALGGAADHAYLYSVNIGLPK